MFSPVRQTDSRNQQSASASGSRPGTGGSEGGNGNGNGNNPFSNTTGGTSTPDPNNPTNNNSGNGTRKSRVHWDGASSTAPRSRLATGNGISPASGGLLNANGSNGNTAGGKGLGGLAGLVAQQQQSGNGPTVSIRSPGGVNRTNHPGPLQLSSRLESSNNINHQDDSNNTLDPPRLNHQTGTDPISTLDANVALGGARSLDEQGLDDRAFLELRRELQRHEDEKAALEMAAGNEKPEIINVIDDSPAPNPSRVRRVGGNETPQWGGSASGASTPGGWTTDSSYDAAADSDLDHIDLISGEVDGMPSKPKRSKTRREEEEEDQDQPKGWAKVRGLFGNKSNQSGGSGGKDSETDMVEKGYQSHEHGGPTNTKALPVTTSSGTKAAAPKSRPSKYEKEAAKLVKAHKVMMGRGGESTSGGLPGPSVAAIGLARGPSINRAHLDSGASTPDALDTMASLDARPVQSGGVLGNLLKLYEQQQREQASRSGLSSDAGTSDISTPFEERGDLASLVASELEREKMGEHDPSRMTGGGLLSPSVKSGGQSPSSRKKWVSDSSSYYARSGANYASSAGRSVASGGRTVALTGGKIVKAVAADAGFDDVMDERPKASRSAAGTIGGLIATTGNLIGAVSPQHAQLGPNPKRPGYTLDRYLLPEMDAKTLRKTAQIVADAAPRRYNRSGRSTPNGIGSRSPHSAGTPGVMAHHNDSSETQTGPGSPIKGGSGDQSPVLPNPNNRRPSSIMLGSGNFNKRSGTTGTDFSQSQSQSQPATPGGKKGGLGHGRKSSGVGSHLHLPGMGALSRGWTHSQVNTPEVVEGTDYFASHPNDTEWEEKMARQEWQRKLKKRRQEKKKKEEIFITMHVAAILQRQEFLMKLARALMMFGAPTHRIETQIQQTARVLEINCRCIYLPNLMLLAFGDDATHTSETKFIKQAGGLDLTKLTDMHSIYWNVIHDKIGVGEASAHLDDLMRRKPVIGRAPMVLVGGLCSAFICVGSMGFNGSFIDALAAAPLGMFLVWCQATITTELFSNVFEIVFATLNSFIAAALHRTGYFCYGAVVSGSIVLILPGFIVLSGSLELQSKNLIAGSVRLVYAIIYSLFLGFGLSIGAAFWLLVSGQESLRVRSNGQCGDIVHDPRFWYRRDPSIYWAFLTVPGYSIALSLRNQVKINRKEFPVMVLIACAGWACNHFSSRSPSLSGRQDITSALGSLAVGLLSNVYGRIFDGRAFVVSIPGILYQLPSGLSNGGLLQFASNTTQGGTSNFSSGFSVAASLLEVALGLTVGLFASTVLAYLLGGRKIRGGGLFSF